jgi:hypothetical protein
LAHRVFDDSMMVSMVRCRAREKAKTFSCALAAMSALVPMFVRRIRARHRDLDVT